MSTAKLFRAGCLALGFALLGSACTGPPRDAGRNGVRGGTLSNHFREEPLAAEPGAWTGR